MIRRTYGPPRVHTLIFEAHTITDVNIEEGRNWRTQGHYYIGRRSSHLWATPRRTQTCQRNGTPPFNSGKVQCPVVLHGIAQELNTQSRRDCRGGGFGMGVITQQRILVDWILVDAHGIFGRF